MSRLWYLLGGFLFSGLLLWLLLRNVAVSEVEQLLRVLNRQYLLLAACAYVCAILLRSLRWQLILASLVPAPYRRVVVALVAGYAVNNLLPARLGEVFRASLAKSLFDLPMSSAIGTIAIERTLDGLTVVLLLGLGLLSLPVTTAYHGLILGVLAGGVALFGTIIACLFLLSGTRSFRTKRIWGFGADKVAKFRQGLSILRSQSIAFVVALSVVVVLVDATAIWFVLAATNVTLTPMQLALVFGVTSLSTLLPTAPGFVGTLQFAYVIGVTSFGFSAAQGIAAATASQLFLLLPLTLVGILLMIVTHVRVAVHLRSSAASD